MGCNIPRPWKRPPTPKEPEKPKGKPILYKCENCGANLTMNDNSFLCEYCGTRYGFDPGGEEVSVDSFYSDGKLVYQEFSKVAHDIGIEAPKLPIKQQR